MEILAYSNEVTPMPWGVTLRPAIRVPLYAQGNTVQKTGCRAPGRRPWIQTWGKVDIKGSPGRT